MTPRQKLERQILLSAVHTSYEKGLNVHAFFKTRDHMVGEDLVQDTFLKTWTYLAKGGKIHLMKSFLYHILNHLIIDEYRKRKTVSLDMLVEKGIEVPSIEYSNTFADMLDGKGLILLLQKLPPKYKKILHMRYIQDLSILEISILTNETKNSITVQIHRGLEKLKILYAHN